MKSRLVCHVDSQTHSPPMRLQQVERDKDWGKGISNETSSLTGLLLEVGQRINKRIMYRYNERGEERPLTHARPYALRAHMHVQRMSVAEARPLE